jgi:sulfite reductase (NADPH) hemoprotein beta-component
LRGLASIARDFDRGFGHFTTRQNIQFNWIKLVETPDILDRLAELDMHAIQTSGNCIRNVTSDPLAGATDDEVENPLVWCEVIRQWSTLHPEFAFLPRKFKIAVSAGAEDRAATGFHDIGLRLVKARSGEVGFRVLVGGGQGRTPRVAQQLTPFLPKKNLLSYLEAILRVYNAAGRRDNIYKARLKILVEAMGIEAFSDAVNMEWVGIRDSVVELPSAEFERIQRHFARDSLPPADPASEILEAYRGKGHAFKRWMRHNVLPHYNPGYANVSISIKALGRPPGDASASEMERIADLADRYGMEEIRVTYSQNVVIPHVRRDQLIRVFEGLADIGLNGGENGLIGDMIVCPGLDYCNLANARSLPLADRIFRHFADAGLRDEIGKIRLNISGCINACGHHHAADIGILGVNKKGVENYQVSLGGRAGEDAAVGRILGPSFDEDRVPDAVAAIVGLYLHRRKPDESFGDAVARLGVDVFKRELYAAA